MTDKALRDKGETLFAYLVLSYKTRTRDCNVLHQAQRRIHPPRDPRGRAVMGEARLLE